MNIDKIKLKINSLKGKEVFVKVNIGRNKYEYYDGVIDDISNNLFTVRVDNLIKSFTFSDILTKDVQLKVK